MMDVCGSNDRIREMHALLWVCDHPQLLKPFSRSASLSELHQAGLSSKPHYEIQRSSRHHLRRSMSGVRAPSRAIARKLLAQCFSRRALSDMATASASRSGERIAVLGGGLAGAYCAHLLAEKGHSVVLFDMGRSGLGTLPARREICSCR